MYTPGNIIYFTPFYFPNGKSSCKEKYFIVLFSEDNSVLIAGLPTRSDHIPALITKKHGCIRDASINLCCYFFENNRPITESGWGFPLDSHIYGDEIDFFDRTRFDRIYKIPDVDYEVKGKLTNDEFVKMLECFKNSPSTKRGIRRKLGA